MRPDARRVEARPAFFVLRFCQRTVCQRTVCWRTARQRTRPAVGANNRGASRLAVSANRSRVRILKNNPYHPASANGGSAQPQRKRSLLISFLAVVSVLICVSLIVLMVLAWWMWLRHRGMPAGIGSFPYLGFAKDATSWAGVGCSTVFILWGVFWAIRGFRRRRDVNRD